MAAPSLIAYSMPRDFCFNDACVAELTACNITGVTVE